MPTILVPHLLLPKPTADYRRWAVIACDQFTSEPAYWQALEESCGDVSTLRLILPEYYLAVENEAAVSLRIEKIHATMREYLAADIFYEVDDFVLVERTLPTGGVRVGMMIAIDLEQYDFRPEAAAPIRATEATVESRLPIRVRIRDGAPLELSHALALVDDAKVGVIERLYAARGGMESLYDVELNMGGGHLRGWRVTQSDEVAAELESLLAARDFKLAVGDGNHSIASAKRYWEKVREGLSPAEREHHPARYCTCELVNLNSEGLTFHPIHRVVFGTDADELIAAMRAHFAGEGRLELLYHGTAFSVPCPADPTAVIEEMAPFLQAYLDAHPGAKVDYIHGEAHLAAVAAAVDGVGILMPCLPKEALFPYVATHGILPKKAFSLGEAEEKRYYMECKRIEA